MLKQLRSIFQLRKEKRNERVLAKKGRSINSVFRAIDAYTERPYQPTLWEQDWILNEK